MRENFDRILLTQEEGRLRGRVLAILGLLLCLVFFLSIGAYGYFAEEEERSGEIPGAVAVLRDFITENESVAVFLGFDSLEEESVAAGAEQDRAYEERVKEKAAAYIAQKEGGRA